MVSSMREIHNRCMILHKFGPASRSYLKTLPLDQIKRLERCSFSPLVFAEYLQYVHSTTIGLEDTQLQSPFGDNDDCVDTDSVIRISMRRQQSTCVEVSTKIVKIGSRSSWTVSPTTITPTLPK